MGFIPEELPWELGVVDLPVGVVGLSFSFFVWVEGVEELEEAPLLGLLSHQLHIYQLII